VHDGVGIGVGARTLMFVSVPPVDSHTRRSDKYAVAHTAVFPTATAVTVVAQEGGKKSDVGETVAMEVLYEPKSIRDIAAVPNPPGFTLAVTVPVPPTTRLCVPGEVVTEHGMGVGVGVGVGVGGIDSQILSTAHLRLTLQLVPPQQICPKAPQGGTGVGVGGIGVRVGVGRGLLHDERGTQAFVIGTLSHFVPVPLH